MDQNQFDHQQFISSVDTWITQLRTVASSDQRLGRVLTKLQEVRNEVGQYRGAA